MSGCGPVTILDGGKLIEPRVIDPNITGGAAANMALANAALTGGVTADDAVLDDLAAGLGPKLDVRTYVDCHDAEIADGANVATCDDLDERVSSEVSLLTGQISSGDTALSTRIDQEVAALDAKITTGDQALADKIDCDVAAVNAALENATDPEKIAGVFLRTDGTQMGAGAKLLTAEEVGSAIQNALADIADQLDVGGEVASLSWDSATQTLTLVESKGGQLLPPKSVFIGGYMPAPSPSDAAPTAYNVEDGLPTAVYGSRNALLGAPTKYMRVTIAGTPGWMPFYAL